MIKKHRRPAACHEYRETITHDKSLGMINLEAISADKLHHKRSEWLASLKRPE
jgi:hypothetical protein